MEFIQSHIGPTHHRCKLYGFGKRLLDNTKQFCCVCSIHWLVVLDRRSWCILDHRVWSLLSDNLLWPCTNLLSMLRWLEPVASKCKDDPVHHPLKMIYRMFLLVLKGFIVCYITCSAWNIADETGTDCRKLTVYDSLNRCFKIHAYI